MELRTLGGLELPGAGLRRPKLLLLLAYLSLEGAQDRHTLATLFWPDSADPLVNLRMALRHLRQHAPGIYESSETQVRANVLTDVGHLLSAARRDALGDIERLYHGPFVKGVGGSWGEELEEWIYTTREEVAGTVRGAYRRSASRAAQAGELELAGEQAARALHVPGARPVGPEELALLYPWLVQGRHPAAATARALAREYGLTLPTPEDGPHGTLPDRAASTGALLGRGRELQDVLDLLRGSGLLTLLGPGGVGKSTLAAEVARQLRRDAAGPVAWVSLENVPDPSLLAARILDALGLPPPRSSDVLPLLIQALCQQPTLLILDNFEHLIGPERGSGSDLIATLLLACPDLRVLVTSREPLHLPGERLYRLSGLADRDAATLFVRRARRVAPDFDVTAENADVLVRLCALLDGLPLAVELAAAWARTLPLAELVSELTRNLDLLMADPQRQDGRHASLRAVFDHSWTRLGAAEQSVLRRLAVFQGGFARQAADAVAGASLAGLAALVDQSMLRLAGGGRFEMHPLVGQFVAAQLALVPGEQAAAREAHARFFVALAETAGPELYGPDQERWFGLLSADQANLREASEWGLAHGEPDLVARFQRSLWIFVYCRESYVWGRQQLVRALRHPAVSPEGRAVLLWGAGGLSRVFGETDVARAMLDEATELAERCGVPDILLLALIQRGMLRSSVGQPEKARQDLERALQVAGRVAYPALESYVYGYLGRYFTRRGQYAAAEPLLRFAAVHARQFAGPWQQALASLQLANHLRDSGQLAAAGPEYETALHLLRQLSRSQNLAECLVDQATLFYYLPNHAAAREGLEQGLHLLQQRRAPQTRGACFTLYGRMALDQGRITEAKHQLLQAVQEYEGAGLEAETVALLPVFARLAWCYEKPLLAWQCLRTFDLLRRLEAIELPLPERRELEALQQQVPAPGDDSLLEEPLPLSALVTRFVQLPTLP